MRKRKQHVLERLSALDRNARIRLAVAGGGLLLAVTVLATCGACGTSSKKPVEVPATLPDGAVVPVSEPRVDASSLRDPLLWQHAKNGEEEDLAALAAHEGAAGLVEATADAELRPTALRAMGYARGWAQLPALARVATGKDNDDAELALGATLELAVRPRTAEDPEDADELQEGCRLFGALARDAKASRARRVAAIRALRMIPCPPPKEGEGLPTDLDSK